MEITAALANNQVIVEGFALEQLGFGMQPTPTQFKAILLWLAENATHPRHDYYQGKLTVTVMYMNAQTGRNTFPDSEGVERAIAFDIHVIAMNGITDGHPRLNELTSICGYNAMHSAFSA